MVNVNPCVNLKYTGTYYRIVDKNIERIRPREILIVRRAIPKHIVQLAHRLISLAIQPGPSRHYTIASSHLLIAGISSCADTFLHQPETPRKQRAGLEIINSVLWRVIIVSLQHKSAPVSIRRFRLLNLEGQK